MNQLIEKGELSVQEYFAPFEQQAKEWMEKAAGIRVTDESQTALMEGAREARLALRAIRIGVDKKHKELKEDALRTGQTLDKIKRTLVGMIEPIEAHLQEQEDFIKVREQRAKDELFRVRKALLEPFIGDEANHLGLGDMSEDVFKITLNAYKVQREQQEAEAKKLQKQRELAEKEAIKERARISAENEKLKKDVEKKNAALEKERAERKRLEDESRGAKEKEEQAKRDKINADRRAKRAPDKERLLSLADHISSIRVPDMKDDDAIAIGKNVKGLLEKTSLYIHTQVEKL